MRVSNRIIPPSDLCGVCKQVIYFLHPVRDRCFWSSVIYTCLHILCTNAVHWTFMLLRFAVSRAIMFIARSADAQLSRLTKTLRLLSASNFDEHSEPSIIFRIITIMIRRRIWLSTIRCVPIMIIIVVLILRFGSPLATSGGLSGDRSRSGR